MALAEDLQAMTSCRLISYFQAIGAIMREIQGIFFMMPPLGLEAGGQN